MNRRKALSLLLAASMVFSMNSIAFAAEETATVEAKETVSTQAKVSANGFETRGTDTGTAVITEDLVDAVLAAQKNNKAQSNNSFSVNSKLSEATFDWSGMNAYSVIAATGKKIKATDIWGANEGYNSPFYVSANGYKVGIKSVKITSKGQKPGDTVKFKFAKLLSAKNVVKLDGSSITLSEAKKAYKDLKSAFKGVQGLEYQSVVCPRYITNAVSMNYVKDVIKAADKKQVSWDAISPWPDWRNYKDWNAYNAACEDAMVKQIDTGIVVTVKNGAIKKVQLPVLKAVKSTNPNAGKKTEGGTSYGLSTGSYYKIGFKTLSKKEYTLSGNYVLLDPSSTYIYNDGNAKYFEVK